MECSGDRITIMPRRKKPDWDFPPEVRARWRTAPNLKPCRPKFGKVGFDKFIEHIKKDKCKQCFLLYRQLNYESRLIAFLRQARN